MFTLAFIILLSIVTVVNNKQKEISDDNEASFKFDDTSIAIISSCLGVGIILDISVKKYLKEYYFIIFGGYMFISLILLSIANYLRITSIEKEREEIEQIFQILDSLIKTRGVDIDFNNIPFTVEYNKGNKKQIDKIIVTMENPERFTDNAITQAVYNLNKFLPYRQWVSEPDFPERVCTFIGNKLPPALANYPGSDLRPWNWIPLGLGGNGELGWNLGAKEEDMGKSMYVYSDTGLSADTVEVSKAPQCLTVGATGGGKSVWVNQIVDILDNGKV